MPIQNPASTRSRSHFPIPVPDPDRLVVEFGDGESSTEQNPVHIYKNAGTYTVTLTVNNPYGMSSRTIPDFISAGVIPSANFVGNTKEGPAPLDIQFNDLSTGSP